MEAAIRLYGETLRTGQIAERDAFMLAFVRCLRVLGFGKHLSHDEVRVTLSTFYRMWGGDGVLARDTMNNCLSASRTERARALHGHPVSPDSCR